MNPRAGGSMGRERASALRVWLALVAAALIALLAPGRASWAAAGTLAARAEALGLSCSPVTSSDGISYTKCSGELPSFDTIGLETDISFPSGATAPLPTMLMLHGWSENKAKWEADSRDPSGDR